MRGPDEAEVRARLELPGLHLRHSLLEVPDREHAVEHADRVLARDAAGGQLGAEVALEDEARDGREGDLALLEQRQYVPVLRHMQVSQRSADVRMFGVPSSTSPQAGGFPSRRPAAMAHLTS